LFLTVSIASLLQIRDKSPRVSGYIVVYHNDINATMMASHMSSITSMLSRRDLTGVGAQYNMDQLKGYQVTADPAAIAEIAASPEVAYIEKDAIVTASALTSQTGATYGLGRISHRNQDSTTYVYDSSAGSGITVYVVDTGIYTQHSQFGGRASFGANFISGSAVCQPRIRRDPN
jgi:oryzin